MFQFVSKRFETIESVDLDIFSLFQHGNTCSYLFQYCVETFRNRRNMRTLSINRYISLYSPYVSMFQFVAKHMETHAVTCFNIVLKRFGTGET